MALAWSPAAISGLAGTAAQAAAAQCCGDGRGRRRRLERAAPQPCLERGRLGQALQRAWRRKSGATPAGKKAAGFRFQSRLGSTRHNHCRRGAGPSEGVAADRKVIRTASEETMHQRVQMVLQKDPANCDEEAGEAAAQAESLAPTPGAARAWKTWQPVTCARWRQSPSRSSNLRRPSKQKLVTPAAPARRARATATAPLRAAPPSMASSRRK